MNFFFLFIFILSIFTLKVLSPKRNFNAKGKDSGQKLFSDANKDYYARTKAFSQFFENTHQVKDKLRAKYDANQAKKQWSS